MVDNGNEFLVNSHWASNQSYSATASLPNGNFAVTWQSDQDGSYSGVYTRIFDANGNPLSAEIQVNSYTPERQGYPEITALNNGSFAVTWQSTNQDGSGNGVYAQIFDQAGNKIGNEFKVNGHSTGSQSFPDITTLANGDFVVSWHGSGQSGSGVYAKVFHANGSGVTGDLKVNTVGGQSSFSSIIALADGNFVVSWKNTASSSDGSLISDPATIKAQIFNPNGAKIGNEFSVSTNTEIANYRVSIAPTENGGFIATWITYNQNESGYSVSGQRFDAAGTKLGLEFQINTTTSHNQSDPHVLSLDNGTIFVTWSSTTIGFTNDIFGRFYDANGTALTGEISINTADTDFDMNPSASVLKNGKIVITWHSGVSESGGSIFAKIIEVPNNAPTALTLGNLAIDENVTGGVIGTIAVSDVDSGDNHTYSVDDDRFEVVNSQLKLKADIILNFEAEHTIALTITATDTGDLSVTWSFEIAVNDVNDAPVAVDDSISIQVPARLPAGSVLSGANTISDNHIINVLSNDSDADGDIINVTSVDTTNTKGAANIVTLTNNSATDITATVNGDPLIIPAHQSTQLVNYSSNGQFGYLAKGETATDTFQYTISDGHSGVDTATVTVNITGENDAPNDITITPADTFTNQPGAVLGSVHVADIDINDTHTFSVDDARFEVAGGQLKLKEGLDFANTPSFNGTHYVVLNMTATDPYGLARTEQFVVGEHGMMQGPVAVDDIFTITESGNAEEGEPLILINPLFSDALTDTGSITTTGTIILDTTTGGTILFPDANAGAIPFIFDHIIDVLANDLGTHDELRIESIDTTQTIGSAYYVLSVPNNQLAYSTNGKFEYLSAGEIGTDSLTYTVSDGNGHSSVGHVTITITGENDAPTDIILTPLHTVDSIPGLGTIGTEHYTYASVDENAAGAVIGAISTSDVDLHDAHAYTISDARFEVVAGQLKLKDGNSLNYENGFTPEPDSEVVQALRSDGYESIAITATDPSGSSFTRNFIIAINDKNEAPTIGATIPAQSARAGNLFSFAIAANAFSDVDGDALTYSATLGDGSALPAWISFNAATEVFTGTPPSGAATNLSLAVTASDGEFVATQHFAFNVATNVINGTAGHDILNGTATNDVINGLAGNDLLSGGLGADSINGGAGIDTASYTDSDAGVTVSLVGGADNTGGAAAGDTLTDVENLSGSPFADSLTGSAKANILYGNDGNDIINGVGGDDILYGGNGDDILSGGAGKDALYGGAGIDTASYSGSAAVTVNLETGATKGGDAKGDTLTNIENLSGSSYNDTLTGNAYNNLLSGAAGNDILRGGGGNDTLYGGLGLDSLTGGAGNDSFYFTNLTDSKNGAYDTIQDFMIGQDKINLGGLTSYGIDTFSDLTITQSATETIIKAFDTAHPGAVDSFELHLKGVMTLHDTDFAWG